MKNKSLVASALALLATSAGAQSMTALKFNAGDNGGALGVAQSKFGRAQTMSTAIVDINDVGNAEIAVKFDETCEQDRCDISLLYYGGGSLAGDLGDP
ncbi:hypothetical protein AYJ57_21630 (plasmid) [Salipiger sp. CCB-MM3]|uniref:hypothetical protein n=1 Tax=Salipiger sp. CCB-MM3 TaxID=1792508 RepID=UPI00080A9D45|nr:hypothetical protein [Salipiger sp. CCB-MM3]ANT63075.1 hypothetical protein AYJ57_21630 [Salipiger sp. CCB-MM3]